MSDPVYCKGATSRSSTNAVPMKAYKIVDTKNNANLKVDIEVHCAFISEKCMEISCKHL